MDRKNGENMIDIDFENLPVISSGTKKQVKCATDLRVKFLQQCVQDLDDNSLYHVYFGKIQDNLRLLLNKLLNSDEILCSAEFWISKYKYSVKRILYAFYFESKKKAAIESELLLEFPLRRKHHPEYLLLSTDEIGLETELYKPYKPGIYINHEEYSDTISDIDIDFEEFMRKLNFRRIKETKCGLPGIYFQKCIDYDKINDILISTACSLISNGYCVCVSTPKTKKQIENQFQVI